MTQTVFDAIITAGYNPTKVDPLIAATGVHHKALIPIAGHPMGWHAVRALEESGIVRDIVMVGVEPADRLELPRPVHLVPNQPSLWASQKAGLEALYALDSARRHVMAITADTPLLTGAILRWFADACQPLTADLYWGIVRQGTMVQNFPTSRRTYLRVQEGSFCSGDLFIGDLYQAMAVQDRLRRFLENRKNVFKQVRMLGPRILIRYLLRRLTLAELLAVGERFLGITGKPVILPFAEAGMDVDKPHQLQQVLTYLAAHPEHPAHTPLSMRTRHHG